MSKEKPMPALSPQIGVWLNVILAVVSAVAGASAQLTTIFGQGRAQAIISICALVVAILSSINAALHAAPEKTNG
jgi:hypothetical protein